MLRVSAFFAVALSAIALVPSACDPTRPADPSDGGAQQSSSSSGSTDDGTSCPKSSICAEPGKRVRIEDPECKNKEIDTANCGACDHSCLGGACSNALCAPQTLALDDLVRKPIALDGAHVVFVKAVKDSTTEDQLWRVPKTGGAPQMIGATGKVRSMVVAGERLIWSVAVTKPGPKVEHQIEACVLPGCTARTVLVPPTQGGAEQILAVSGTRLFWINGAASTPAKKFAVESCELATCAATIATLSPAEAGTSVTTPSIAVTSERVFWSALGVLHLCPKSACPPVSRVDAPAKIGKVATNGVDVFFWAFDDAIPETQIGHSKVLACPVAGCSGPPRTVVPYSHGSPAQNDIAADAKRVYQSLGDQLEWCPVAGCGERDPGGIIQASLGADATIQLDDTHAYVVHESTVKGFALDRAPK